MYLYMPPCVPRWVYLSVYTSHILPFVGRPPSRYAHQLSCTPRMCTLCTPVVDGFTLLAGGSRRVGTTLRNLLKEEKRRNPGGKRPLNGAIPYGLGGYGRF